MQNLSPVVNSRGFTVPESVRRADAERAVRVLAEQEAAGLRVLDEGAEQRRSDAAALHIGNALQILDQEQVDDRDLAAARRLMTRALELLKTPEPRDRAEWRVTQLHEPATAP